MCSLSKPAASRAGSLTLVETAHDLPISSHIFPVKNVSMQDLKILEAVDGRRF